MATWNELVGFLATNYSCTVSGDSITLPYTFPNGRSQNVYVNRSGNETRGEWVFISSAIAEIDQVAHLEAICRVVSSKLCGGIVIDGNVIALRDSLPLENLNDNEINSSIDMVVAIADELEQMFAGRDYF
jgi:hypothetical protein